MLSLITKCRKVPVEEFPNNVLKEPLVSVCIQTYQHVNYIRECLDSILMQETKFHFEVLVGEDDSTDGTREICLDYAKKYADRIRLFLHHRENNIKVGGYPTGRFNLIYNLYSARGKYIALCEGDDYWIDPHKLEKQVDFLEANPDYGMVYTDKAMVDDENNIIETTPSYEKQKSRYNSGYIFFELLRGNFINTPSVVVRKELFLKNGLKRFEQYHFDWWYWLNISMYSRVYFLEEKCVAYRIHADGMLRKNKELVYVSSIFSVLDILLRAPFVYQFTVAKEDYIYYLRRCFRMIFKTEMAPLLDKLILILSASYFSLRHLKVLMQYERT